MQGGEELIVLQSLRSVPPRILQFPGPLPMHLHNRRKTSELGPTHEQVRGRLAGIGVLVAAYVMTPDGEPTHRRGLSCNDHAGQAVVTKVRFVVACPATRKGLCSGKAATGEKHTIL